MFITRPRIASQNSDEKTCMYRASTTKSTFRMPMRSLKRASA